MAFDDRAFRTPTHGQDLALHVPGPLTCILGATRASPASHEAVRSCTRLSLFKDGKSQAGTLRVVSAFKNPLPGSFEKVLHWASVQVQPWARHLP